MEIAVRHAVPEDRPAVHEIFQQAHVLAGTQRLPYAAPAVIQARLAPKPGLIQLVAEVPVEAAGRVVGFAELITYPDHPRHHHVAELNMIAVHEDWQGQGIGRRLMTAITDLADNWLQLRRVQLIAWTNNEHALRLFADFGFELEGIMPEFTFYKGRYIDGQMMSRLKCRLAGCGSRSAIEAEARAKGSAAAIGL